ncbi:MAG: glycoside hydrolase family 16 protein [Pseudonocardia sp.]
MSRCSGRLRSLLVCAALLLASGCAGATGSAEPDLLQALPEPAPAPTAVPDPPPGGGSSNTGRTASGVAWRQVNSFDFDGTTLDPKIWNRYNSVGGFGNGFRRPSAITVANGLLRITARGNVSGGMGHERDQLYGRWEFRARTEKGRGRGAAMLLWPQTENKDDGELDMMEVPREDRSQAHFVIHYSAQNKLAGNKVNGDFSQWHTFAMDWLPDRITWYVDGVKQFETFDRNVIPTSPMHLAIQLDMGPYEEWILAPDETTPAEVSLEVDRVRVYERR